MAANRKSAKRLAEFEERSGRRHRVVLMADRLVLDIVGKEPPRVVALLGPEEGIEHARAIVFGREGDEGYVERARRERAPICRRLAHAELRPPEDEPSAPPDDDLPEAA